MKSLTSATFALLLSAAAPAGAAVESQPLWPEGQTPYAREGDAETGRPKLFPYIVPEDKANGCAVVVTPGGGYGGLAADHEGHQIAQWWNERGVSAFVLHYRLGSHGHHFPTQLADVQRAIRTVRANADRWHVDPARIGVMGFSAGGHLASMAATKFADVAYAPADAIDGASAHPDFADLCYPVISMENGVTHGGSRRNLLGPEKADDEAAAKAVSSELNVTTDTPPTFIFQTDADTAVPAENAVRFYLALRRHGVPAEMHIYQRGQHGVGLFLGDPVTGTWSALLDTWMQSNGRYAAVVERVPISGEVTLDGKPVSWGRLTFHPTDPAQPVTTTWVRRGKFGLAAGDGPPVGEATLSFTASIWEATDGTDGRVVQTDRLAPGDPQPVTLQVTPGLAPLGLAITSE